MNRSCAAYGWIKLNRYYLLTKNIVARNGWMWAKEPWQIPFHQKSRIYAYRKMREMAASKLEVTEILEHCTMIK